MAERTMPYVRQTTETCKGLKYESKANPYIYGKQGCIYTSGCGPVATSNCFKSMFKTQHDTKWWRDYFVSCGARGEQGTIISAALSALKKDFGIIYKKVTSVDEVVSFLKSGNGKVIMHNPGYNAKEHNKGYFSSSGHFVAGMGYGTDGLIIVHDPYWYENKFMISSRRKVISIDDREVYIKPADLEKTCDYYYLITPPANNSDVKLCYSKKDVNFIKKAPAFKTEKKYTLTNARGIYNGCGANTGRKKVKDLTADGQNNATSKKSTSTAFFKANTIITLKETKLAKSGNLWGRCPSGWLCIWEKDIDRTFIKLKE